MAEREEGIVREFLDVSVKGDFMGSLGYFADAASYRINAWN